MSMSFYIKPKKSLFKKHKPLSLLDAINLSSDELMEYSYCTNEDEWIKYAPQLISEFDTLRIAKHGYCARGFELSYDNETKAYVVRVNTPSSLQDWEVALRYVQELSQQVTGSITDENGEQYTVESILSLDYLHDVTYGIDLIASMFAEGETSEVMLHGYMRPVAFNQEMIDEIKRNENPAQAFGETIRAIQDLDAYNAKPMGAKKSDVEPDITVIYVISENLPIIIPRNPAFGLTPDVIDNTTRYVVVPSFDEPVNEADHLKEVDYQTFIEMLTPEQYTQLDAVHLLIHPMSRERMLALPAKEM